jgi:tRNA threonylcarbamoyladenosine biosynthesis protein TsaB
MKILAIETTDTAGSVALLEDNQVQAEVRLNLDQRSAQSLAPAIQEQLQKLGWKPGEVKLVGVAIGPGSFTGLRVGVTTAKTFAFAVKADVVGLNTLEVIAAQAPAGVDQISVVVDAQRQQLFAATMEHTAAGTWQWVVPTAIVDIDAWLTALQPGSVVSGPGLQLLTGRLPNGINVLPTELWAPKAATVGALALHRKQAGMLDDAEQLVPIYFRRSAAEEKRDQPQPPVHDPETRSKSR